MLAGDGIVGVARESRGRVLNIPSERWAFIPGLSPGQACESVTVGFLADSLFLARHAFNVHSGSAGNITICVNCSRSLNLVSHSMEVSSPSHFFCAQMLPLFLQFSDSNTSFLFQANTTSALSAAKAATQVSISEPTRTAQRRDIVTATPTLTATLAARSR